MQRKPSGSVQIWDISLPAVAKGAAGLSAGGRRAHPGAGLSPEAASRLQLKGEQVSGGCWTKAVQGCGGNNRDSVLDNRTSRRIIRPSVVGNEQLTHKETGRFRRGIYEPDGWRSTRMRLIINNLHPKGPWMARTWISDWPSHNHSSA
jgi:hypothetical protein